MSEVQFYRLRRSEWDGGARLAAARSATPECAVELWRPKLARPFPPGRSDPRILSYSVMHAAQVFANGNYSMLIFRDQSDAIVHSSLVMPGFSRFPFMAAEDLQIGVTATRADQRGRGLASRAIDEIVERFPGRRDFWYLTDARNTPSIAVIRKAGFTLVGTGKKHPRMGMRFFGQYRITSPSHQSAMERPER